MPFYADQFFWAWRVRALGVGPPGIPRKRLTVDRLAEAVRTAVAEPSMRFRAEGLAQRIGAEDGVGRAVTLIERLAEAPPGDTKRQGLPGVPS